MDISVSIAELIQSLQQLLAGEFELYQDFYQLAVQKKAVLINQNMEELDVITRIEEEKLAILKNYEEQREKLIEEIKTKSGLTGSATMNEIFSKINGDTTKIRETRDLLKEKILEVKELNDDNSRMIENSLDIINKTMKTLGEISKKGKAYSKEGKVHKTGAETRTFETEG